MIPNKVVLQQISVSILNKVMLSFLNTLGFISFWNPFELYKRRELCEATLSESCYPGNLQRSLTSELGTSLIVSKGIEANIIFLYCICITNYTTLITQSSQTCMWI